MAYRIAIDKRWTLEDFYTFPRAYEQVYFLTYALSGRLENREVPRIHQTFEAFPWRGGYSAVSFYNQLKGATSPHVRPTVLAIQYASPGYIELGVVGFVALTIAHLVKTVASSIREANATCNEIHSDLQRRKLLKLEVRKKEIELAEAEMRIIVEHADTMAKIFGFSGHQEITRTTGNPFVTLKILLSYFRRIRTLAKFYTDGKIDLP